MLASASRSILAVVDLQPSFLNGIVGGAGALARSTFLVECARLLEVPIVATEQYPMRMGGTEEALAAILDASGSPRIGKLRFACAGCEAFDEVLDASGRKQVVLCGIETHICVTQTALLLRERGFDVLVAADAVAARSVLAHDIGLARMRQSGVQITHTESVVYEWMQTANHERFRDVLKLVKGG